MRLWLARHAAVLQAPGLCYGASDLAADPQETEAAATRLARALPPGIAARCSPLQRCRSLADRLQGMRPDLCIASDLRLAEMDFGQWEGQAWDAIGEAALTAWSADFAHHRPGGGESVRLFMARVGHALREFAVSPGAEGLWITHAGVIKAVRLLATGQPCATRADQWPVESVSLGDWTVLDLPSPPTNAPTAATPV